MADSREIEFRRRWYEAHVHRFGLDTGAVSAQERIQEGFIRSAVEALALRDTLARTGDVEAFRARLQEWAVKPGTLAFNGFSGQMMVNQLAKKADESPTLAPLLTESLTVPRDDADAGAKLQALVDYIDTVRVGAHPAPGHTPFLLSYFWALQDHREWPVLWASAAAFVEFVTGVPLPTNPAERYVRFHELVVELDDDNERFERVASWWDSAKPVFLDPVLADRCAFALDSNEASTEALAANATALSIIGQRIGAQLVDDLSKALDHTLMSKRPPKSHSDGSPHADLRIDWVLDQTIGLGLRLWINGRGASLGLRPGWAGDGWYAKAQQIVTGHRVADFELISGNEGNVGVDHGHRRSNEFTYGRWFDRDALGGLDLRAEMVGIAAGLQPTIDALQAAIEPPRPKGDDPDPLSPLVAEFLAWGYPTLADEQERADRERFAGHLAPDAIGLIDPTELRRIWTTRRYGSTGAQSGLSTSLRDADAAEYDRIIETFRFVCWGEGDDDARIDKALGDQAYAVRGLGESVVLKLLAICHPERYLKVYPYSGPHGKRGMLQLLGLPEPSAGTRGQLHVQANDQLRQRLDRFFPNDAQGMSRFLYWYAERKVEPPVGGDEVDPLEELAEELLVDRSFLDEIVGLLEDKGQVVLYGPPGTGKTYLARKLAEALVPDATRRALVQFHPSTSYEDFFEGYRPETSPDGEMTYRLTPGPLALLAAQAMDAPGKRHIMIIDEINRANLPKVLGELLFLLEYRSEQIRTLYRPDDPFELPKDLWFIGTMNTADRSIALVDAALRRRFQFVPFFPDRGPMKGLLKRWLDAHHEPGWVGELVAMVNDELTEALGGPHLQLGPSYFMRTALDEQSLGRVWRYNIEPFIEDQFFGDPAQIEYFGFDRVLRRYRASVDWSEDAPLGAVAPAEPDPTVELDPGRAGETGSDG